MNAAYYLVKALETAPRDERDLYGRSAFNVVCRDLLHSIPGGHQKHSGPEEGPADPYPRMRLSLAGRQGFDAIRNEPSEAKPNEGELRCR